MSSTPRNDCPPLEDLAALHDGTLAADDAARVRAHLGDCPDCYELFVLTAETEADLAAAETGAEVVPFRRRWTPLVGAVAALLALALGAALLYPLVAPPPPVDAIAERLEGDGLEKALFDDYDWGVLRGAGDTLSHEERQQLFRIGVQLADLEVALAAGDGETAEAVARRIGPRFGDVDFAEMFVDDYAGLATDLESGLGTAAARQRAQRILDDVEEVLAEDPPVLDLGFAAEAARLAAEAQDEKALRRWLRLVRRYAEAAEEEDAIAELELDRDRPLDEWQRDLLQMITRRGHI